MTRTHAPGIRARGHRAGRPYSFRSFGGASTALALAISLAGCASMAPSYAPPPLPVPDAWPEDAPASSTAAALRADAITWEDYFVDPVLRRLITVALVNNRDLRVAALRVEEAASAFRIQRSERFPMLGLGVQGSRSRIPGDLLGTGASAVGSEYRAELGVSSWELDLWGRVRNLEASALERWFGTEAGRRAVQVSLIAQVADTYFGLRELDERAALARRTVAPSRAARSRSASSRGATR